MQSWQFFLPTVNAEFISVRGVQSWLSFHHGLLLVLNSSLSRDAELAVVACLNFKIFVILLLNLAGSSKSKF
jgi:hypothetical protein